MCNHFHNSIHCFIAARMSFSVAVHVWHLPSTPLPAPTHAQVLHFSSRFGFNWGVAGRELLHQGVAMRSGKKRTLVVFSDCLVVTKERALASSFLKGWRAKKRASVLECEELVPFAQATFFLVRNDQAIEVRTRVSTRLDEHNQPTFANTLEPLSAEWLPTWAEALDKGVSRTKYELVGRPLSELLQQEHTNVPLLVASIGTFVAESAMGTLESVLTAPCTDPELALRSHSLKGVLRRVGAI